MNSHKEFFGFVIFLPFAEGSLSDSFRPALVCGHGINHSLIYDGDNPFENETLRPFHRLYCKILGELDQKRNFIKVHEITQVEYKFEEEGNHSPKGEQ